MKEIKFIHAADLHLDSPMVGLKTMPEKLHKRLRESTFLALNKITTEAIKNKVDFVIFAGDLFDSDDRSIRAQSLFRKEMEKLLSAGIPAFVIHGNHDHEGGTWTKMTMPSNVHTFSTDVEQKSLMTNSGTKVHLYGFSYNTRHVTEKKINQYEKKGNADFHIGILHGNLEGQEEHGNYSPFQLKDLLEKQFDYWALGHIHKRAILTQEPPVVYPGNIQGRNRKELEMKGCYLVQLQENTEVSLTFIKTSDIVWKQVKIEASKITVFDELYRYCQEVMESLREENAGVLLSFIFDQLTLQDYDMVTLGDDLLEALQEQEQNEALFVWPFHMELKNSEMWSRHQLEATSDFYKELFKVASDIDNLDDSLSNLYEHQNVRKLIRKLTDEEKKQLLLEAEQLLVQKLLSGIKGEG